MTANREKTGAGRGAGSVAGLAALSMALSMPASATILTENFVNTVFEDGGIMTGSFQWDSATNTIFGQHISTSGGSTLSPFTYDVGNSAIYQFGFLADSTIFRIAQCDVLTPAHECLGTIDRYISIKLLNPLSEAGGIDPFVLVSHLAAHDFNAECDNCEHFRVFVSGAVEAAPEPASLALLGLGFAALGFSRRRPRQA